MSIPSSDDLRRSFIQIVQSNYFQQVAPLIVLIFFPLLVLNLVGPARRVIGLPTYNFVMVLESIGLNLPWNWSWSSGGASGSRGADGEKRKSKKRHPRTRGEQIAMNGMRRGGSETDDAEDADYYPGLVNISGTYCFMNSTLQAMSSLSYLQPHIDAIHAKAVELDVPTPVIDALRDLFDELNTPLSRPSSVRPLRIIQALTNSTKNRSNALLYSREHQDAQELFQLLTECLKNEISAIEKERSRDRGFGGALSFSASAPSASSSQYLPPSQLTQLSQSVQAPRLSPGLDTNGGNWIRQSVFDGLTANRRSCMQCGYTEAVMHFAFDNWQLSVPHYSRCSLEECLEDYTRLEILYDCICRKCSLLATHRRLVSELKTLEEALKGPTSAQNSTSNSKSTVIAKLAEINGNGVADSPKKPSASKKRRAKEVAKMEARVRSALEDGRIEEDLQDVRMEKVVSRASSKQAMIARPPPVLALHLNRSSFGHYASKNNAFVEFPEILDLTPYTTSGNLSTVPSVPISTPPPSVPIQLTLPPRSRTPTPAAYEKVHERVLYRLSAVVCHYGSHSFGHYVCYRRKPRPKSAKRRWSPPTILDPLSTRADEVEPVDDDDVNSDVKREPNGSALGPDDDDASASGGNEIVWADEDPSMHRPGRGWLRVSDDSVMECGIETVLREGSGAFMLYYERIRFAHTSPYPSMAMRRAHSLNASGLGIGSMSMLIGEGGYSPRSSEETLRPELRTLQLNMVNGLLVEGHGSTQSLVSEVGVGVAKGKCKEENENKSGENETENGALGMMWTPGSSPPGLGPRVVRSVAAGRGRSLSAAPSEVDGSREGGIVSNPSAQKGKGKEKASESMSIPNGDANHSQATGDSAKLPTKTPLKNSVRSSPSTISLSSTISSLSTSTLSSTSSSILSDDSSHLNASPPTALPLHSPQPHHPPSPVVGLKA